MVLNVEQLDECVCVCVCVLLYRVMEEIDEVVGDKTSVEAGDLDKLTYMNQVGVQAIPTPKV